ncbi:MAG: secondary thiamine-phosphate synthase enzyme YjbQ [Aquificaceae bacterium]|nr:secondary thiamine-phosphate synthase enzyme YjbQ [Aquificaceae bacterium]MCS7195905.1 secondary thiamine-phosphate synthase enzyme YjbQ [Aquificaceae bacterium]MCX7989250.1 secondary thiamine-phosphate synthase enzyme YjbQ [Aquificaceae bacterium]MDW8032893.1 secondary thiamine-phosphate synthase enzyme YjbQ [Aquificaceae bacterium]MDW8294943.1 secondary thiamine-phosphate synthase enzyme YjbQ [Aquificaceae bacterium]
MVVIRVRTTKHTSFVNITSQVREAVRSSGVRSGMCLVYVPHTTACVFVNEGADPDVVKDIAYSLEKLIPWKDSYAHGEGNSAAHIRSALVGNSRVIPVEDGELVLGTWEAIFLAEFDGPRERKVIVKVIKED